MSDVAYVADKVRNKSSSAASYPKNIVMRIAKSFKSVTNDNNQSMNPSVRNVTVFINNNIVSSNTNQKINTYPPNSIVVKSNSDMNKTSVAPVSTPSLHLVSSVPQSLVSPPNSNLVSTSSQIPPMAATQALPPPPNPSSATAAGGQLSLTLPVGAPLQTVDSSTLTPELTPKSSNPPLLQLNQSGRTLDVASSAVFGTNNLGKAREETVYAGTDVLQKAFQEVLSSDLTEWTSDHCNAALALINSENSDGLRTVELATKHYRSNVNEHTTENSSSTLYSPISPSPVVFQHSVGKEAFTFDNPDQTLNLNQVSKRSSPETDGIAQELKELNRRNSQLERQVTAFEDCSSAGTQVSSQIANASS